VAGWQTAGVRSFAPASAATFASPVQSTTIDARISPRPSFPQSQTRQAPRARCTQATIVWSRRSTPAATTASSQSAANSGPLMSGWCAQCGNERLAKSGILPPPSSSVFATRLQPMPSMTCRPQA